MEIKMIYDTNFYSKYLLQYTIVKLILKKIVDAY